MKELKWDGNTISNQKEYTEEELIECLEQINELFDKEVPLRKPYELLLKLDTMTYIAPKVETMFQTRMNIFPIYPHRNLQQGLDFYSKKFKKIIHTEIIERRRFTYKLKLENGKIIIKKKNQLDIPKDWFPKFLCTA